MSDYVKIKRFMGKRNIDTKVAVFPDFREAAALHQHAGLGRLIGHHDSADARFDIYELGLMLNAGCAAESPILFDEIIGWDEPRKRLPPQVLVLHLTKGTASLSFPNGDVFTFVRMLGGLESRRKTT